MASLNADPIMDLNVVTIDSSKLSDQNGNYNTEDKTPFDGLVSIEYMLLESPYNNDSSLYRIANEFYTILKTFDNNPYFMNSISNKFPTILKKLLIPSIDESIQNKSYNLFEISCLTIISFFNMSYYYKTNNNNNNNNNNNSNNNKSGDLQIIDSDLIIEYLDILWDYSWKLIGLDVRFINQLKDTIQVILLTFSNTHYCKTIEWISKIEPIRLEDYLIDDLFYSCLKSTITKITIDEFESMLSQNNIINESLSEKQVCLNDLCTIYNRWRVHDLSIKRDYILEKELSLLNKSINIKTTIIQDEGGLRSTPPVKSCYKYYLNNQPSFVEIFNNSETEQKPSTMSEQRVGAHNSKAFDEVDLGSNSELTKENETVNHHHYLTKLKSRLKSFRWFTTNANNTSPAVNNYIDPLSSQPSQTSIIKYRWMDWFWGFWYPVDDYDPLPPNNTPIALLNHYRSISDINSLNRVQKKRISKVLPSKTQTIQEN